MPFLTALIAGYALLTCLLLVIGGVLVLRQLYASPHIREMDAPPLDRFPSLTVIIPACNEAEKIEPALRSVLAQDYPDLTVIAINDRSTDDTGDILDRLDSEFDALQTVHIDHLPEGWVGKPHALMKGYEKATGEWVLFTDADVHYETGALRSLMAVALHEDLDQMSCFPTVQTNGFLHEVAFDGWIAAAVGAQNLEGVRDPESDEYFALGAFNLVRRTVFDQTKGFSWLRMEIADDMGTAKMMRDQGARQGFYFAFEELRLEWYGSLKGMMAGLEKNGVAVLAHYRYLRGFLIPLVWGLLSFGPIVGLFVSSTVVQAVSVSTLVLSIPANTLAARRLHRAVVPYLFSFLGIGIVMYALVRSTYACAQRGGVAWRGTTYPVEKLREHQRVQF
jgi:glycosyltransferase involved in cell wall biosynthesis